eukprot:1141594-Pelagomonas_calceolata.AAC.6
MAKGPSKQSRTCKSLGQWISLLIGGINSTQSYAYPRGCLDIGQSRFSMEHLTKCCIDKCCVKVTETARYRSVSASETNAPSSTGKLSHIPACLQASPDFVYVCVNVCACVCVLVNDIH